MAKLISFDEVANHKCKDNCWLLIHGKVYNVSSFMEEHPGGEEALMGATGKDATDEFEEIGHSDSAKELMQKYYVGDVDKSTVPETKKYSPLVKTATNRTVQASSSASSSTSSQDSGFNVLQFLVPLLILAVAFAIRFYTKKQD